MATGAVTVKERIFADIILRALGAKLYGGAFNPYLEAAIIAWARQETGSGTRGVGKTKNNWLGFMSGGQFVSYKTYQDAARAAAARLLKYSFYAKIVEAARIALPPYSQDKAGDQREQAKMFILALAMSPWSGTHYGYKKGGKVEDTTVYAQWVKVLATGALPPIPAQPSPGGSAKRPPKPQPKAPKYLQPPPIHHAFPDPHEARRFYMGRRPAPPSDTMGS